MKRILLLVLINLCFSALSATNHLKVAILELKPGVGVTASQADGLSDMLTLELYQSGYFNIKERARVKEVIKANNFTNKQLSKQEQQLIGRKLEVEAVLIGTINYIIRDVKLASDGVSKINIGEYNIDIRLISVSDGSLLSSAGALGGGRTDRELMNDLAIQLGQNLDKSYITKEVHLLYDYLYVYPEDLGIFSSHPGMLIDITNKNASYGYSDWRLPTKEEMSLLEANTRLINLNRSTPYAYNGIWNHKSGDYTVRLVRSKIVTQQQSYNTNLPYFENETLNFGSIPIFGGSVTGSFQLHNSSQDEIYIRNVITTNSSIRSSWNKNAIHPGESTFINVTYNPNGRQGVSLNHTINVELSNGQRFTLYVKGKVK